VAESYLEKLKKEYGDIFGGATPPISSSEYTTESYRPGATHEAALRKMVADDPSGIGILPSGLESDYTKAKTGRLGDGARIEDLGKEMPMIREDLLPYMDADRMLGPVSYPTDFRDPSGVRRDIEDPTFEGAPSFHYSDPMKHWETETVPGHLPLDLTDTPFYSAVMGEDHKYFPEDVMPGSGEVDSEFGTGETLRYDMTKGRLAGAAGGAYEKAFAKKAEEDAALVAKSSIEADAWYASPEYAHEEKLRESEKKRPEKLTYWTKDKPWSVEASREKYPDWHPLDTMPAWYTKRYTDPDAAAYDALTVPEMKIWGIGPGVKDPLSGKEGGLSFMSPDKVRTFSSVDMEKGFIPETPAMLAADRRRSGVAEDTRWITPEWLTPRGVPTKAEIGDTVTSSTGGPASLYASPAGTKGTDVTAEILDAYDPTDYRTRIGPMIEEVKGEDPVYHPTAYPDLAWYTSWGDAERIAGYPASWDYDDVVKDRVRAMADDSIFGTASPWAEDVAADPWAREIGTFATDYRGEDPREYLEERTSPEYYPLPKYVSGMHEAVAGGDDTDWYAKVIDDWYGGVGDSGRGYARPMSDTSPEVLALLEELRETSDKETEPLDYSFGPFDFLDPAIIYSTESGKFGDTSASSSTAKSRAIAKSWAEDYPFISAPGGFDTAGLRDRMASAYGYSPEAAKTLEYYPGGDYMPGWAAAKAEEALARPIATGAAKIAGLPREWWEEYVEPAFGVLGRASDPDLADISTSGVAKSFADYVRGVSTPSFYFGSSVPESTVGEHGSGRIPAYSDLTKLWAEDIVKPAFGTLSPHSGFVSTPISYTHPGADAPWLLPSGEAPTLDFSVEGFYGGSAE
jgi:hypothetical protein